MKVTVPYQSSIYSTAKERWYEKSERKKHVFADGVGMW